MKKPLGSILRRFSKLSEDLDTFIGETRNEVHELLDRKQAIEESVSGLEADMSRASNVKKRVDELLS